MAAAKKTEEAPQPIAITGEHLEAIEERLKIAEVFRVEDSEPYKKLGERLAKLEKLGESIQKQIKGLEQFGKELREEIEVIKEALPKPAAKAEPKVLAVPDETFKALGAEFKFVKAQYRNRANQIVSSADALDNPAELEWLAAVDAANIEKVK